MSHDLANFNEHRVRHDKTMDRLADILARSEEVEKSMETEATAAQMEVTEIGRIVLELMAFQKALSGDQAGSGFHQEYVLAGTFLRPEVRKCWKFRRKDELDRRLDDEIAQEDKFACVAWTDDGEVFVRRTIGRKEVGLFKISHETEYTPWDRVEKAAEDWRTFDGAGIIGLLKDMVRTCEMDIRGRSTKAEARKSRVARGY